MGKPTGFIDYAHRGPTRRPVAERVQDYDEVYLPLPQVPLKQQAARCMDCGVPFCQTGCPLGNLIPDWNDLVYRDQWRAAYDRLRATNNFPEFTGRICPAPCESACVLGLTDAPVTIEHIEQAIVERAFAEGWVRPEPPPVRTGATVAVVGSGPAGLACADQLNRTGHGVVVFERDDRMGGLLRYGIPDFKLPKALIARRLAVLEAEGIRFVPNADLGGAMPVTMLDTFDAVVLCTGSTLPRDLPLPGRDLDGIHYAMDYLTQQNRRVAGDRIDDAAALDARGKHVVVIGGGDTASDCIGTANRQGARSVTNFHLWPAPPAERPAAQPWPYVPQVFQVSPSHEEGCDRVWAVQTLAFEGASGMLTALRTVDVEVGPVGADGRAEAIPVAGTERVWPADLVLLAIGYTGPGPGLPEALGLARDGRGLIHTDGAYATSRPGIFAAGDARRGQSLVVWAISEGREVARAVDTFLTGTTALPARDTGDLPSRRAGDPAS